jgi:hypothetical protein
VLDLILDAFEEQPTNLCFVPLVERFRHGSIAHILGFKFTMYHLPRILKPAEAPEAPVAAASGATGGAGSSKTGSAALTQVAPVAAVAVGDNYIRTAHAEVTGSDAPQSLYILAAMLVMNNLVDLEDLLPYLRPSVERLGVTLQALEAEIAQQAASFGVVSLNSTKSTTGKAEPKVNANLAASQLAPVSADVTAASKPVATSTGRKPAAPVVPIASTGVTLIPAPPAKLKAPAAPAPAAVTTTSNTSPRTASSGTLNRVQSSTKLNGGATKAEPPTAMEVDATKFDLFYDASNLPAAPATAEAGEMSDAASAQKDAAKKVFAEGSEIIGLISALLALRGWTQAKYLLNLLELAGMDPLLVMKYSADLRCALAALVNWQLEDVYLKSSAYGAGHGFGKAVSILPLVLKTPTAGGKTSAKAVDPTPVTPGQKFAAFAEFIARVPATPKPQLAQVVNLADFPAQAGLLLSYCGYHVREFPGLFARLSRLSRACVRLHLPAERTGDAALSADTDAALEPVLSLVCNVLLPALSAYQENNPFLAGQVWAILHELPFVQRFAVYDRWYGGGEFVSMYSSRSDLLVSMKNYLTTYWCIVCDSGVGKEGLGSKHSEVVLAETVALHGARAELKRLAKENTKQVGRKLARFTQTCPLVVFNHVLSQVEAFDNLIPYMVDTLKFSTELSKDVMAYSLVSQLKKGSNGDAKLKKGDTHFSQWFSALTKFIATFYCRYPTTELKGLLNYLLQRLSVGDSLDLLVLKELLGIMGGSETLLEVSPAQLEGLSGGRSLRAEVMGLAAGVVGSKGMITASACKKATGILRDELIGSQTAIPLLLFIAQVRSRLLHDAASTQLKLISHLYDTAQDVLMQFTEFLVGGAKSLESIASLMPDLSVLLDEVGLAVPVAFQLVRPLLRAALQSGVDPAAAPAHLQRWHPFGTHITALVQSLKPAEMWQHMSQRLFIIFWSLGLYDIRVPVARYETEIKRLKDRYTEVDNKKLTGTAASLGITPAELSKQVKARESELKLLLQKVADLTDDLVKQKKHVEQIKDIMRSEQDTFFRASVGEETASALESAPPALTPEDAVSACITQHLLFQRLLMSPIDAVYCTQFAFLLHEMQTPLFSTLHLLDRTIRIITPLIFCSTEAEASFVGYALLDLLQVVNRWQNCDEATYNAEASGKLGFSYRPAVLDAVSADATPAAAEGGETAMEVDAEAPGLSQAKFKELCKVSF